MRKQIKIVTVLGILVFACILSAGCTSTDTGIPGTWELTSQSDNATYVYTSGTIIFKEDGTGFKTVTSEDGDPFTNLFIWTRVNETNYHSSFRYIVNLTENETALTVDGDPAPFSGNGFIGTWTLDEPMELDDGLFNGTFIFEENGTGSFAWHYQNGTLESTYPLVWEWDKTIGYYTYYYPDNEYTSEFTILPDGTGIAVYHETYWETYNRITL